MDKGMMLECLINHYSDGNQAKFAAKLGISAQNVSAWIKRGTYNAELIYEKCENVSAAWLLSGKGEMILPYQQNVDNETTSTDTKQPHPSSVATRGDFSPASVHGNAEVTVGVGTAVLRERVRALESLLEEKERLIKVLMGRKE